MAFVNCPKCGAILTDKIKECPNCALSKSKNKNVIQKKVSKVTKKQLLLGGIAAIAILFIMGFAFLMNMENNKNIQNQAMESNDEYIEILNKTKSKIYSSEIACENIMSTIYDVFQHTGDQGMYNSVTKYVKNEDGSYNDLETSLQNLFADSIFYERLDIIKKDKEIIENLLNQLQNPPNEFKDCYDMVIEFNEIYNSLVNLISDPASATENVNQNPTAYYLVKKDFVNKHDALVRRLKEITEEKNEYVDSNSP